MTGWYPYDKFCPGDGDDTRYDEEDVDFDERVARVAETRTGISRHEATLEDDVLEDDDASYSGEA
jgi:hypothetical protein